MSSYESVKAAISRRIAIQHLDLITEYGIISVTEEIEQEAASFHNTQLDEIGTSDVSCWVLNIKERLERYHTPTKG